MDHRFHLRPTAEDGAIAVELLADLTTGDITQFLAKSALQLGGQNACCRALAAARGTDH